MRVLTVVAVTSLLGLAYFYRGSEAKAKGSKDATITHHVRLPASEPCLHIPHLYFLWRSDHSSSLGKYACNQLVISNDGILQVYFDIEIDGKAEGETFRP